MNVNGAIREGTRWRLTLERHWSRKLDEVIALAGACEGLSAAGDDEPVGTATLPSPWLQNRAAVAYEELGDVADAITRLDDGTYGLCADCGQAMTEDWLARDPATRYCRACLVGALVSPASPGSRTG